MKADCSRTCIVCGILIPSFEGIIFVDKNQNSHCVCKDCGLLISAATTVTLLNTKE